MLGKIKEWIFGTVILKKVFGKFAKHATGALIGLLTSGKAAEVVSSLGITFEADTMEAGMIVFMTAAFGAIWNFVEHRVKK